MDCIKGPIESHTILSHTVMWFGSLSHQEGPSIISLIGTGFCPEEHGRSENVSVLFPVPCIFVISTSEPVQHHSKFGLAHLQDKRHMEENHVVLVGESHLYQQLMSVQPIPQAPANTMNFLPTMQLISDRWTCSSRPKPSRLVSSNKCAFGFFFFFSFVLSFNF